MFEDQRSRRVALVAHCLLNQNAISDGTAIHPCAHLEVVRTLLEEGIGILQMPCPELCCLGLDRGDPLGSQRPVTVENTRIRRQLERPLAAQRLAALVDQVAYQVQEYHRHGFVVVGIIGANRSPSCGVETTSDQDREVPGKGVFLEALCRELARRGLEIPCIGVKAGPEAAQRVRSLLEKSL